MTPETKLIILWGIILFLAMEFVFFSYWLYRTKRKPEPPAAPEIAFRWPDEVELRYRDAAGNVMASRWYVMEKPGE